MRKRLPLIITIALVIIAGSYFLYEKLTLKHTVGPWALIPESSVGVYESGSCVECLDSIQGTSVWKIIQQASLFEKSTDSLNRIYDIVQSDSHKLISLHVTKKDDFNFLYYIDVDNPALDK